MEINPISKGEGEQVAERKTKREAEMAAHCDNAGIDYGMFSPLPSKKRKDNLHGSGAKEDKRSRPEAAGAHKILPLQTVNNSKTKLGSEAAGTRAKTRTKFNGRSGRNPS